MESDLDLYILISEHDEKSLMRYIKRGQYSEDSWFSLALVIKEGKFDDITDILLKPDNLKIVLSKKGRFLPKFVHNTLNTVENGFGSDFSLKEKFLRDIEYKSDELLKEPKYFFDLCLTIPDLICLCLPDFVVYCLESLSEDDMKYIIDNYDMKRIIKKITEVENIDSLKDKILRLLIESPIKMPIFGHLYLFNFFGPRRFKILMENKAFEKLPLSSELTIGGLFKKFLKAISGIAEIECRGCFIKSPLKTGAEYRFYLADYALKSLYNKVDKTSGILRLTISIMINNMEKLQKSLQTFTVNKFFTM